MPQPRLYRSRAEQQAAYRQRTKRAQEDLLRKRGLPVLPAIPTMPGNARWRAALEQARTLLEQTAQEMQDYHDDRSEQWQESDQASNLMERVEAVEQVADQIQDIGGMA